MEKVVTKDKRSILPAILAQNEASILAEWMREMSIATRRGDLMNDTELSEQCSRFLRLMRDATDRGGTDFQSPSWDEIRTMLSVEQIAALLADGNDLRRFKNALTPIAASIPMIKDPAEREKRLREAAAEVASEWKKYKKRLPMFALEALADTTELKWPEFASLALGQGTALAVGAGAGLSVALLSFAGVRVWRAYKKKASSPYSYLSKIANAENESYRVRNQSFLILPPP
jgi:hypothetical protein